MKRWYYTIYKLRMRPGYIIAAYSSYQDGDDDDMKPKYWSSTSNYSTLQITFRTKIRKPRSIEPWTSISITSKPINIAFGAFPRTFKQSIKLYYRYLIQTVSSERHFNCQCIVERGRSVFLSDLCVRRLQTCYQETC